MHRRLRLRLRSALFAPLLLHTGCFAYVPAELAAIPDGHDIRVYLSTQEKRDLEDDGVPDEFFIGSPPAVVGTLTRRQDDRLFVQVPVGQRQVGFHAERLGQEIPIRSDGIVHLERRALNRVATGLTALGAAGLAATVVYWVMSDARRPVQDQFPEPENIRIPALSLPLRPAP